MKDGAKLHATYSRFSILKNHGGQYVYQLESATPKESNMQKQEKQETNAAAAGIDRLSAESMQEEFFDELLLPYSEAKNRKKRWSWGDGMGSDLDLDLDDDTKTAVDDDADTELSGGSGLWGDVDLDELAKANDAEGGEAAADDVEESREATADPDALDDWSASSDALDSDVESESVVEGREEGASDGGQAEDVEEGKNANAEDGDEKRTEEREESTEADADQNVGDDSGEGREATFSPEAMGESEEPAAKKDGEDSTAAKTEDGKQQNPDDGDEDAKDADSPSEAAVGRKKTTTAERFYYPLVNAAFQPGDCFNCGDCKMCPAEISLTIFPARK